MAIQYQIPGGRFICETGTRQYQIPGGAFISETVSVAAGGFFARWFYEIIGKMTNV